MARRKFCVVDGEGDAGERGLLGVAIYSDQVQRYLTDHRAAREAIVYHAESGYTLVSHNAQYDIPVVGWQLDIPFRVIRYEGRFNRGEWRWHPKRPMCQWWDSLDLAGGVSVARLGEAIGLPKYDTPQSLQGVDPDRYTWRCELHQTWECVECYALRDAEIVYRYLEYYADVLAGWSVAPQRKLAGAAIQVWRSLDPQPPIKLRDGKIRHMARQAYYGGRVETFKLGHFAPLYAADVTSMYPSVMLETPFPDPAHMVLSPALHPDQLRLDQEGVSECRIAIPPGYIPPLPTARRGERLFAVGRLHGFWTHLELRHAVSLGARIERVYRSAWSEQSVYPFTQFVSTLWEARNHLKQRRDPRQQVVKILLNSCYGRIGLRGNNQCEVMEPWGAGKTMADYPGATPIVVGGKAFVSYPVKAAYDLEWANVLWAAQITAAARVKLHRYLLMQGENVVYCDTDSVFSTAPIMGLGEGLGALSDPVTYAQGWIIGPKLYRLESADGSTTLKAKGIPQAVAESFLAGNEVVFQSPVKPWAQARTGKVAGTWVQLRRSRQLVPHRRTPTNPAALQLPGGSSDTLPEVVGLP